MGFTEWLESLTPMADVARFLAGLGITTVFLAYLKRTGERRCWRRFKAGVDDWMTRLIKADRHPNELSDEEWMVECERMLTDANFTPSEIVQVLDSAVMVAKGIAADKVFM